MTRPAVSGNGNGKHDPEWAGGDTLIAPDDSFQGSLRMRGDGTILGSFQGEIECSAQLVIGPEAKVAASIRAHNLTISGYVEGNVVVTGRLQITGSGRLEGDAKVAALVVQEGGVHVGLIKVHPEGVPAEDQRVPPLIQRPLQRPAAPETALVPPGPAPAALADGEAPRPVDRVKKLWGEFF